MDTVTPFWLKCYTLLFFSLSRAPLSPTRVSPTQIHISLDGVIKAEYAWILIFFQLCWEWIFHLKFKFLFFLNKIIEKEYFFK